MCLSYYKIAHPFQQVSIRSFCRPLFYRQQTVYLPPVQRCAVGGEKRPPWKGDIRHDMACALPPPGGGGKRGIRHRMVSYPPLNSPSSSLGRDSLRSRVQKRGAHRDVWCSKGTSLMEAELFAAERGRPAPSGRALLCAANHASEIQGSSAVYKLKDARNRAPVTPV